MVQRKVPSSTKLGIQASDFVQSNKLMGNLKPFLQNQDGKKKMKKSRSIKLPDMDPVIKTREKSPNYMKPTSSSDARKENSPVSVRNTQTDSERKNSWRRSSSKSGGDKTVKMVRSLTKTTSFKPARAPVKKYSDMGLCAARATCSSILKDSKFPDYLELNHGGTESEGVSVIKVCPYTYCSLNGHYHTPLVPLKSFLKVKRRSLKSEKSARREVGDARQAFVEKPEFKEVDAGMDIFVEIYADAEASFEGLEELGVDRELARSEFDVEEDFGEFCDTSSEMDITESDFEEEDEEDVTPDSFCGRIDFEDKLYGNIEDDATQGSQGSIEDDVVSEATKMVWEEGRVSFSGIDNEVNCLIEMEGESDHSIGCVSKIKNFGLEDAPVVISDDIVSNCHEEILADEILCEVLKEESECSETQSDDCDSEDAFGKVPTLEEKGRNTETGFISTLITLAATSNKPSIEIPEMEIETNYPSKATDEDLNNHQANTSQGLNNVYQVDTSEQNTEIQEVEESETEQNDVIHDFSLEQNLLNADARNMMEEDEVSEAKLLVGIQISQDFIVDDTESHRMTDPFHVEKFVEDSNSSHNTVDESLPAVAVENGSIIKISDLSEKCIEEIDTMQVEDKTDQSASEAFTDMTSQDLKNSLFEPGTSHNPELPDTCNNITWTIKFKKPLSDCEEERKFNPREPNYLSLVPDPEAEKVDLRHQMMDDRKNSEEWMLDFALQQAVTKLAPARKKKVALLVEAFETVTPIPKYTTRMTHTSAAFAHTRPIQACR